MKVCSLKCSSYCIFKHMQPLPPEIRSALPACILLHRRVSCALSCSVSIQAMCHKHVPHASQVLFCICGKGAYFACCFAQMEVSHTGEDICCLKLRHKVEVPASRLSCESPTCAKWSPHAPCNELLVGTDLGTVAVIVMHEAHGSTGPSFSVCSLVRSGISSVRCLAWAPVQVQHGPVPSNNANLFCVCAGQSVINIYDTRQPQVVALDLSLGATGVILHSSSSARI